MAIGILKTSHGSQYIVRCNIEIGIGLTFRLAIGWPREWPSLTSGGTDLLQHTNTIYLVLERLKQIMALLFYESIDRTCLQVSRGLFRPTFPALVIPSSRNDKSLGARAMQCIRYVPFQSTYIVYVGPLPFIDETYWYFFETIIWIMCCKSKSRFIFSNERWLLYTYN